MVRRVRVPRRVAKKLMKRYGRRKGRKTVNVNRALQPIPQRYICKMKYSDQFNISTTTLAPIGAYRFNMNSIFDPNQTGVGHQPYGHDTFQTLYNRYRVIKCSWTIQSSSADGTTTIQTVAMPANEVVGWSNLTEAIEQPRAKFITQGLGAPIQKLKGSCHLPSLVGRNKAQYMADDRYQATFGTSPAENAILNIYAGAHNGAAINNTINCSINIVYTVEMFDVKNLSQS